MGSCLSTKNPTQKPPSQHNQQQQKPKDHSLQDRALVPESDPPLSNTKQSTISTTIATTTTQQPSFDEETVKEVLSSETPTIPKPRSYLKFKDQQKILRLPSFPKIEEKRSFNTTSTTFEEISELSEICSLSESVSTSALTEHSRDYDEVMQPRIIDRSPSKIRRKRSDSGEFYGRGGDSPLRRSDQWINGRSDIGGKSMYGKEVGPICRRNNAQNGGVNKDHGETSRRRSRSPATRIDVGGCVSRPGMCRSPSAKRVVRSSVRSPGMEPENRRNFDESKEKWPVKESLEDPLVSLECFIFL
ncbi:BEST plant protein match is: (TAIR:plant.1) protein [Thalictrum thalictroides]|uniref:BEST plant protein match is: (TAIR:plant.1) protein n=1 Tax=Thalictrum thalictroides TaxID=46969 RepID=A0A7J6UZA6_THATH|nr:BEST plant protein match is: (TAIR:plant.1) protein [Thalictrum thalictroides]